MQLVDMTAALTTAVKVKKPKKKKVVDVDSLIAALDGDGSQVEAAPSAVGEPATAEVDATEDFGAKKKRSKKKSSKMDFSSAFEELGVQDGADTAEAAPAEGAAHSAEGAAEGAAQSPEGAAQSPEGKLLHLCLCRSGFCRLTAFCAGQVDKMLGTMPWSLLYSC